MRALFLLGMEKTRNEVGCYACYFPSICEIWNNMISCWQLFHVRSNSVMRSLSENCRRNSTKRPLHFWKQLTTTVSNLWLFLGLKIRQETDLTSELRVVQTKLSMKLVTQYTLLCYSYLFTPPCFSDGERKNSVIFDCFRASISRFLPQTYWTAVYTWKSNMHENPHRVFFGSLLEALVAMDANIDLIKCSKI